MKLNYSYFFFHPIVTIAALMLPLIVCGYLLFSFYSDKQSFTLLEERMELLFAKSKMHCLEKEKQSAALEQIKKSDPFYIDRHLESLLFLEPEIKRLQSIIPNTEEKDPLRKRLSYLLEGNRLHFLSEKVTREGHLQEVEECQQIAVELNAEDLQKVLVAIEGLPIGPLQPREDLPHLVIKEFKLAKKALLAQEEVYTLMLQLIKKELIQKEEE